MDKQILMQPVEATELNAVDGGDIGLLELGAIVSGAGGLWKYLHPETPPVIVNNTCNGGGCIQTTNCPRP